jgi:hypothetical protein
VVSARRESDRVVLSVADSGPVDKSMIYRSGQSVPMYLMGVRSGKITLDFAFDVLPQDLLQPVMVIMIDGDGNKHQAKANLAGLLNFGGEE